MNDAGRPPVATMDSVFCHLVESWQNSSTGLRTLNVYTNAPFARILVNGAVASAGGPVSVDKYGSAQFTGVQFAEGHVTAEALATRDSDVALSSDTKRSWGQAAAVVLSIDAPSVATGTGTAVYLDGSDVALVRATIVDKNGTVVHNSSANVTFTVSEGPARVLGVGNGDPADRTPPHAAWKPCYHGMARAIVRTRVKATGDQHSRALEALVNVEAGTGPLSSKIYTGRDIQADVATSFTVRAFAEGLKPGSLTVPLSTDERDNVLMAATASVGLADVGGRINDAKTTS